MTNHTVLTNTGQSCRGGEHPAHMLYEACRIIWVALIKVTAGRLEVQLMQVNFQVDNLVCAVRSINIQMTLGRTKVSHPMNDEISIIFFIFCSKCILV